MVRFVGVTKIYPNGTAALNNVNIDIEAGEFVFIVGMSGSGKTTLLKLILKEESATYGEVEINGYKLSGIDHRGIPYLRRNLGVVFQDFRLLPRKTAYENVAFAMEIVGASPADIRRTAQNAIDLVGLTGKEKSYPSELSGGEQQRVALARAFVNSPPILIADEPTGNLDPGASDDIMYLLREINALGPTIVVATHERSIVDKMRMRVIELADGAVVRDQRKGRYGYEGANSRLYN